jgi:serine protease
LTPAQYIALLKDSATPFPTGSAATIPFCHVPAGDLQQEECICTTETCGAGMLNTRAAVLAAQGPLAVATAPNAITTGSTVTIDASDSFASIGRSIMSYQWAATSVTGGTPTFGDASQPLTTVRVSDASTFTLRLTVTDDQGTQDTADVAIAATVPPPPPPIPTPPPASGGSGGGGSLGWLMLLALLIFVGRASARLRSPRLRSPQLRSQAKA